MALRICVFTAFSLVPKNCVMRGCGVIHGKHNSSCENVGTCRMLWPCFAGLRDLRGYRSAFGRRGVIGEPAGSREARGAREETRRTAAGIDTGFTSADESAPNHHSCCCCASVHHDPAHYRAKDRNSARRGPNRDQTKRPRSPGKSTTTSLKTVSSVEQSSCKVHRASDGDLQRSSRELLDEHGDRDDIPR